jgi:hypothetical protein
MRDDTVDCSVASRRLQRRLAVFHPCGVHPDVCFVSRPNQMRPYKDAAVHGLHLADDDEVGVHRIADEREVAERARRP